jgi:hypothetical protein
MVADVTDRAQELVAAVEAEGPSKGVARALQEVPRRLTSGEDLVSVAAAVSGPPGVVMLTSSRLVFLWKGSLGVKENAFPLDSITSVAGQGSSFRIFANQLLAFDELQPASAVGEIVSYIEENGSAVGEPAIDQSALRILPPKARNALSGHIGSEETVKVCLSGASGQSLVALDSRLLVVKPGFMAGRTFGAKVSSFDYREVIGIEVVTGVMSAVLQVQTANFPNILPQGFSNSDPAHDPFKLPNCVPLGNKRSLKQPNVISSLNTLRQLIHDSRTTTASPGSPDNEPAGGGLAAELEKLRQLNASGALSDEEFQKAKAKLLE